MFVIMFCLSLRLYPLQTDPENVPDKNTCLIYKISEFVFLLQESKLICYSSTTT